MHFNDLGTFIKYASNVCRLIEEKNTPVESVEFILVLKTCTSSQSAAAAVKKYTELGRGN